MAKMRVNMDCVWMMVEYRRILNSIPLDQMEFYRTIGDRYPIEVSQKAKDDWDLTGLNVIDFITGLGELK